MGSPLGWLLLTVVVITLPGLGVAAGSPFVVTAHQVNQGLPLCAELTPLKVNVTQLAGRWLAREVVMIDELLSEDEQHELERFEDPDMQEAVCGFAEVQPTGPNTALLGVTGALGDFYKNSAKGKITIQQSGRISYSKKFGEGVDIDVELGAGMVLAADPARYLAVTVCKPASEQHGVPMALGVFTRSALPPEELETVWSEVADLVRIDLGERIIYRPGDFCF